MSFCGEAVFLLRFPAGLCLRDALKRNEVCFCGQGCVSIEMTAPAEQGSGDGLYNRRK